MKRDETVTTALLVECCKCKKKTNIIKAKYRSKNRLPKFYCEKCFQEVNKNE